MANYSRAAIALWLLAMLSTSPMVANSASNATRVENNGASNDLQKLNVSFPQYTYRYNTSNYKDFKQPTPTVSVEGETPTITTINNDEVVTISGGTISLTGNTGIAGVKYTYPATDSHAEATANYSIIVTQATPTLVGTASEWNDLVSKGDNCANIKLTNDITLDADSKTFNQFSGIIDGDGHTITVNINSNDETVGLIRGSNGAYIKNLRIAGTIKGTNASICNVGGFIGYTESQNYPGYYAETVIENCASSAEIIGESNAFVAGFIGRSQNAFTIKNCQFDGKIASGGSYGRFVCYNWDCDGTSYTSTITRCLSTGSIDCNNMEEQSKGSTNEMVYAIDNKTDMLDDGAEVLPDSDDVLDGTFCYKTLNENIAGGPWKQHIGYEKYPSLSSAYTVKSANAYVDINVKANSLSTMALPVSIPTTNNPANKNVRIYTVTGTDGNNDVLQLEEFTEQTVPAGLPVILYNTSNSDVSFYAHNFAPAYYNDERTDNMLQTVYFPDNENNTFYAPAGSYVLQKKGDALPAFYQVKDDNKIKVSHFRCYLKAQSTYAAPCFRLPVGNTTGIGSVESGDSFEGDGKIYDLSGRRVNEMQKGQIYIIGGHKVMVR